MVAFAEIIFSDYIHTTNETSGKIGDSDILIKAEIISMKLFYVWHQMSHNVLFTPDVKIATLLLSHET